MDSRLKRACEGKSESQGGMNVPELHSIARQKGYTGGKNRQDLISFLCGAKAKAAVKPVKPKAPGGAGAVAVKLKPKPVKPKQKKQKKEHESVQETLEEITENATREAERLFPRDKKLQQQYIDDTIGLFIKHQMPSVPVKYYAISDDVKTNCKACHQYIKARGRTPASMDKLTYYINMKDFCSKCRNAIAEQYKEDQIDNRKRYKTYHRGNLDVDTIITHGSKGEYFNQTMFDGAVYWADVAARRMGDHMPSVPK